MYFNVGKILHICRSILYNHGMARLLFRGLDEIATAVKRHPNTVRNWIYYQGFPACKDPGGEWITTQSLVDHWVMARGKLQDHARAA